MSKLYTPILTENVFYVGVKDRERRLFDSLRARSKKIWQNKLKYQKWDMRRIDVNLRIVNELKDLAEMINELWEHPDREAIVGS